MASINSVFMYLVLFSLISQINSQGIQGYGILHATGNGEEADFCVMFNPQWGNEWPSDLAKTPKYTVIMAKPPLLCSSPSQDYQGKAVIADRGNCTFFEKGMNAQRGGAVEAIVINYDDKVLMPAGNATAGDFVKLTIPVAVLAKNDGLKLKGIGNDVKIQLYQPPGQPVDGNVAVLWVLAVSTVVIGAFWAGVANKRIFAGQLLQHNEDGENNNNDGMIQVTPLMVLVFVILICGLLLLLFYFYNYLVYVIIVLFAFASCSGLFECLMPLVQRLPFGSCKVPANNLPVLKKQPEIRLILLTMFCMAMAIWWGIERNASYGWVLQDILGIAFCISLIKNIRLPNLKVCVILLVLLLIYDIFFVFITPLFSASGKSVMVEVATGKDHKEQLPMVLKIPRLTKSVLSVCARPYSLLGFGDILVPGLYVGFCHSFDTIAKTPRRIYFIATTIAYGVGLIITFIALFLMQTGQPALLYLVPCVLSTGIVIGWWRGELKKLWTGKMIGESLPDLPPPGAVTSDSEDEILNRTRQSERPESPEETDRLID